MSTHNTGITPPLAMMPPPPPDAESLSVNVPLNLIVPSKTNPDRAFDPKNQADVDTLESIRVHGVLQPVLLRPAGVKGSSFQVKGHYEIVAGERRCGFSKIAGRSHVPAVVRNLTDVEALEIQYIENDQRKDLGAMGKALALRRLWEEYDRQGVPKQERLNRLSTRLGRKTRTVWNVLSLGSFIPQGQKMLEEQRITISHAFEISRRPRAVQAEIIEWLDEEMKYGDGGVSVRDLKQYIRQECDRFLDSAPFDKKSPTLVEKAGACTDCQKNTAVNPLLLDDSDTKEKGGKKGGKGAICTDRECWNEKVQANLVQIQAASAAAGDQLLRVSLEHPAPKGAAESDNWKEVKGKSCSHVQQAILVDGDNPGRKLVVCATKTCKTHWISPMSVSTHRASTSRPRSDAEKKTMLAKQRNKKADQAFRVAATPALRKAVTDLKTEDLRDLALQMIHMTDRRHRNPIFAAMGWKISDSSYGPPIPAKNIAALKHPDLCAFLALMTVASKVLPGLEDYWPQTHVPIAPFAKRHKIDLDKIEKVATAPLRERWKQIDARKRGVVPTPAKKKAAAA